MAETEHIISNTMSFQNVSFKFFSNAMFSVLENENIVKQKNQTYVLESAVLIEQNNLFRIPSSI